MKGRLWVRMRLGARPRRSENGNGVLGRRFLEKSGCNGRHGVFGFGVLARWLLEAFKTPARGKGKANGVLVSRGHDFRGSRLGLPNHGAWDWSLRVAVRAVWMGRKKKSSGWIVLIVCWVLGTRGFFFWAGALCSLGSGCVAHFPGMGRLFLTSSRSSLVLGGIDG